MATKKTGNKPTGRPKSAPPKAGFTKTKRRFLI